MLFEFGTGANGANGGLANVAVRRLTSTFCRALSSTGSADEDSTKMRVGSFTLRVGLARGAGRGGSSTGAGSALPTPSMVDMETPGVSALAAGFEGLSEARGGIG
jgi:hypothetical protein